MMDDENTLVFMYVQDVQTKLWLNMNAVPLPAPHIFL
jgi:hypothetical protein